MCGLACPEIDDSPVDFSPLKSPEDFESDFSVCISNINEYIIYSLCIHSSVMIVLVMKMMILLVMKMKSTNNFDLVQ